MLRALFERGIRPDLVLGTSVGALNGAMVARDPSPAVIERLTDLWRGASEARQEVYGDRPLRTVRRAVSTGTHIYSAEAAEEAAAPRSSATPADRGPAGPVPGVRGQHRARRRALVRLRPGGRRGRRQRRRPRPAAAGEGRRRALPRRRDRELDPGRPGGAAGGDPDLRAPGRPDRPAAAGAAPALGGGPGLLRDRPAAPLRAGDGRAARRRRGARAAGPRHVVPRRHACWAAGTSAACSSASTRPTRPRAPTSGSTWPSRVAGERHRHLAAAPPRPRPRGDRAHRAGVGDAAAVADRGRGAVPGAARAGWRAGAAAVGGDPLPDLRVAAAGRDARALARGGVRPADPDAVLRGHPLRPGPGRDVGVLPGGAAGAGPADRHRRALTRTRTRASRSWSAAGTPGPATPSR